MSRQMCQPFHPSSHSLIIRPAIHPFVYPPFIHPRVHSSIKRLLMPTESQALCSLSGGDSQEKDLVREKYGVSHNTSDNRVI